MADRPRTRLEQKIRAAHLSQRDVLRRFPAEARRLGENEVAVSERQLKRWLRGGAPTPRTAVFCRVLEGWFGEPVERLLGPPDELTAPTEGGDAVAEAAQRAAHAYLTARPLELFTELVQLRDVVYLQLDRTHKPRQQAELYLIAGEVCGLLSSVSFDLGHPEIAEEHARAAHTYGIGDRSSVDVRLGPGAVSKHASVGTTTQANGPACVASTGVGAPGHRASTAVLSKGTGTRSVGREGRGRCGPRQSC